MPYKYQSKESKTGNINITRSRAQNKEKLPGIKRELYNNKVEISQENITVIRMHLNKSLKTHKAKTSGTERRSKQIHNCIWRLQYLKITEQVNSLTWLANLHNTTKQQQKYTFFPSTYGTVIKINYILGHKTDLKKFNIIIIIQNMLFFFFYHDRI